MVWLVGALAFAMRLWSVLHSGGVDSVLGYDEGVYFSASMGLVNGLIPYRDFVLVHPPAILVILSPFALAARWIGDADAWMAARVFVMLVGAANAMMVYLIGRRAGRWAGITAGLLYAVWTPAIHVERTTMLEAFVLAGMLLALTLLRSPRESTVRLVVAGAALGVAASTKLWGLVPLLVILGWLAVSRAWRSSAIVLGSAAGAAALIVGPFLALAPQRMFDLVVLAQAGRGQGGTPKNDRLQRILGFANVDPKYPTHQSMLISAGLVVAVLAVAALAWRRPPARLWVVLLVAQLAVLIVVPVYFAGYSSFAGPALVLVLAAAVESTRDWVTRFSNGHARVALGALAGGVGLVIVASGVSSAVHETRDFVNPSHVTTLVANSTCVASDSAGMLIAANVMTRDLQRGCPVIFDVDGSVYSVGAGSNPRGLTSHQRRHLSTAYQDMLADYFVASDAVILHREAADGLDPALRSELRSRPLLWEHGVNRLYGPVPGGAAPRR